MSAKMAIDTAPIAPSKVVPLHHFGHEEQVKNTDQGNIAVVKGRPRKHPLPASDLAKVSKTAYEQQLEQILQQLNSLSPADKAKVLAKLNGSLDKFLEQFPLLAKAMSGKSEAPSSPAAQGSNPTEKALAPKDGGNKYDPWNQSILMLYTAFAETQMDQNGKIMNGWESQQQAQNQTLQEAANAEAQNADKPTQDNKPSWWKILLIGIGVAIGVALICTGFGAGIVVAAGAGLVAGVIVGGACYGAADSNPNASGNAGLVEKGPDQTTIDEISFSNQFWSTISQKTNNQISSGSQTNVVNASSNDTSLGQQASQVIQAMGQVMQTPVGH